jgi:hypothetical protein
VKNSLTVTRNLVAKEGWSISICQSVMQRENVSEYVAKVESRHNNVIYLVSCFVFRKRGKEVKAVFCQRNNGVARVLRKSRQYTNAKIIAFRRRSTPALK